MLANTPGRVTFVSKLLVMEIKFQTNLKLKMILLQELYTYGIICEKGTRWPFRLSRFSILSSIHRVVVYNIQVTGLPSHTSNK